MGDAIDQTGIVISVHRDAAHGFSKRAEGSIRLLAGLGVEGDAHMGVMVKHRSRVAQGPAQPNLRQVHLIHVATGDVRPGDPIRIEPPPLPFAALSPV